MQDHPEDITPNALPPDAEAYKDRQHTALRDLIDLSPQTADAAETEIEQHYRAGKEAAEEDHDWATSRIERRGHRIVEAGQRDYQKGVERIRATFEAEENRLRDVKKNARQRIVDGADTAERRAKEKLDHDVWLADSVLEATKNQLVKDLKKLKITIAAQKNSLKAMEFRARLLLKNYRMAEPPLPDRAEPEPVPADDAAAAVRDGSEATRQHIESLASLSTPKWFVGARPHAAVLLPSIAAAALAGWLTHIDVLTSSLAVNLPVAFAGALAVLRGTGVPPTAHRPLTSRDDLWPADGIAGRRTGGGRSIPRAVHAEDRATRDRRRQTTRQRTPSGKIHIRLLTGGPRRAAQGRPREGQGGVFPSDRRSGSSPRQ